jgi:hypothetical protein
LKQSGSGDIVSFIKPGKKVIEHEASFVGLY